MSAPNQNSYSPNGQYGQDSQQGQYGQPVQQTQNDQQVRYGQQVPPAVAYPNAPQPVPAQAVLEPQWVSAASGYLTVRFVHTISALALPILAGVAMYCAGAFFGGPEALRIVGLAVIAVFGLWVCGGF